MTSDQGGLAPVPASRKRAKIPEIEGLDEPKPLVHRSIEVVEQIFLGAAKPEEEESWLKIDFVADQSAEHVRNELLELIRAPYRSDYMNQSVAFWRLLDREQDNIIMFCRERSPVANLFFQMVRGSRLSEDFLNGYICESDFPCMVAAAGALARAPLRICDARDPDAFLRVLFDAYPYFDCAICDWTLEPEEINAISRMTKDSPIAFLCPQ
ncbi:MAG: hypothetical protein WCH99_02135 [Verrucomicrobiota bacterium]